jgi:hypothetical protein
VSKLDDRVDKAEEPEKTPRASTGQWRSHVGLATDYADRLRGRAQAAQDVEWGKVLRDMSDVALSYARLFRRWSSPHVVVASVAKFHEHDGFKLFMAHADFELARTVDRPPAL